MVNDFKDLTERMDSVEKQGIQRKKNIQMEYAKGKSSPTYYKERAMKTLERIVNACETWKEFKLYIEANPQEFSEEERIQCQLETYLKDSSAFYRKKKE